MRTAERQVAEMQEQLRALQPELATTRAEVEVTMATGKTEGADAAAARAVVAADEAVASRKALSADVIRAECETELAGAVPLLDAALAALDTLTKADISEVKALKSPPAGVKLVMEAVCHMLGVPPKRAGDVGKAGPKVDDFWTPSQVCSPSLPTLHLPLYNEISTITHGSALQGLLGDPKFLESLQAYDKDAIEPAVIEAIRPYLENPDFEPDAVRKASKAAAGLCSWVRAIAAYDSAAKHIAPKRAALKHAEDEVAQLRSDLAVKQGQLNQVRFSVAQRRPHHASGLPAVSARLVACV